MSNYHDTYLIIEDKQAYCEINNINYDINTKYLKHALNGDKILVKLHNNIVYIQKVIERSGKVLKGRIIKKDNLTFIKAWDNNIFTDFLCLDNSYKHNDIVEFKFKSWKQTEKSPLATIIGNLNITKDKEYLYRFNIPFLFNHETIKEADNKIINFTNRIDLTHLNIVSIDADKSIDIDDALSFEDTQFGYRIGVHISDVSALVNVGSNIDIEAYKRAFTVYHPFFTIPILPKSLSNNLCSLLQNKDRLAISLMINYDREWNLVDYYIFRSKINVKKNFTYENAEYLLNDPKSEYYHILNNLYVIGNKMRLKYFPKELNLNINSTIIEAENNCIKKLTYKEQPKTYDMVQSWMLICNKFMTNRIEKNNSKCIYRSQQYPVKSKLEQLKIQLLNIGETWNENKGLFNNLNRLLKNEYVKEMVFKCLKPAKYSDKVNHFILGVDDYSYFTSPIHRYVDILNHRILINCLNDKETIIPNKEKIYKNLNKTESRIDAFIKTSQNNLIFDYLKDEEHIKAHITNFVSDGIILKTDFKTELFLPISEIPKSKWVSEKQIIYSKIIDLNYTDTLDVVIDKLHDTKIYVKLWRI